MTPTIIIANYDGEEVLRRALLSIKYSQRPTTFKLCIIDNGSTDASKKFLQEDIWTLFKEEPKVIDTHTTVLAYPCKQRVDDNPQTPMEKIMGGQEIPVVEHLSSDNIDVIFLAKNWGYEAGMNIGMTIAKNNDPEGDVILMGSDVELFSGCIEEFQRTADIHPQIGIVCAKLMGNIRGKYFVKAGGFTNEMGHEHITGWDEDEGVWHDFKEQEWVTFSCVYLRRKMLDEIGYMDMTYHVYFGDNDMCRRARQGGWAAVFAPTAKVLHGDGITVKKVKQRTPKEIWDQNQTEEMGYACHKWADEEIPYPILPEGTFDEANTWLGR